MSFDLYLWDPVKPATDAEVRTFFEEAEAYDDAHERRSARLKQAITRLWRAYPAVPLPDDSPWAGVPYGGKRWYGLCFTASAADWFGPEVVTLCRAFGLVTWNPQTNEVTQPPKVALRTRLEFDEAAAVDNPSERAIRRAIKRLGDDVGWACLQRTREVEHFLQACMDEADTDGTQLWIECRRGTWDRHEGAPATRAQVARAFVRYAAGGDDWDPGLDWKPVVFDTETTSGA